MPRLPYFMVAGNPIKYRDSRHECAHLEYCGTSSGDEHHQVALSKRFNMLVGKIVNFMGFRAEKYVEMSNSCWCTWKLETWWTIGTGIQRCLWSAQIAKYMAKGYWNCGTLWCAYGTVDAWLWTECERVAAVPSRLSCWIECTKLSHIVVSIWRLYVTVYVRCMCMVGVQCDCELNAYVEVGTREWDECAAYSVLSSTSTLRWLPGKCVCVCVVSACPVVSYGLVGYVHWWARRIRLLAACMQVE